MRSALGGCAGLAGRTSTCAGPSGATTARKLVFAARPGAAQRLDLWVLDVGGAGTCRQLTTTAAAWSGAVRVHNFDPVFAPDGTVVFASTRAGTLTLKNFLPELRSVPRRARTATSASPSR